MRNLIIIILMICLVGCRSIERALVCHAIQDNELGTHEFCVTDITFNACRCRELSLDNFQGITPFVKKPLEYCDGMAGLKFESWGENIGPKLKALSRLKEERCR